MANVKVREVTIALMEEVWEGMHNPETLIRDLLNWMSEDEVAEFARAHGHCSSVFGMDEEDEEDE